MKKSLYLLPVMILMLSACGNKQVDVGTSAKVEDSTVNTSQNENSSAKEASQKDNNTTKDGQRVDKDFGSFVVADGFGEAKEQSGNGRYFYVVKGHEHDMRPDISQ